MAAINVQGITKQFGTQMILENASVELHDGDRVGFIGANGSGKTTLLRMIARKLDPDLGTVTCAKGLTIGYLEQEPQFKPDHSLHDAVGSAFDNLLAIERQLHDIADEMARDHDRPDFDDLMSRYDRTNARFEAAGGHTFQTRLNEILGGLGFVTSDYDQAIDTMSGGQRCRAALARLLLEEPNFLLLDEPTNHLDLDAVRWLEKFLFAHRGGVLIISHDRYLLDRVCTRIIELEYKTLTSYTGNFSTYVETKRQTALARERQFDKDQKFIKKERDFITKHIAGQRTKEAQGRRTRLNRRLGAGEFVTEDAQKSKATRIEFSQDNATQGKILRCDDLAKQFGNVPVFKDLSFQVFAGDRLGITGPNGTGKTTLLKILIGELEATSGEFTIDPKLTIGYYSQEHTFADLNKTVLSEIRAHSTSLSEQQARSYLAVFLFRGQDVFKPLRALSGGEQSRVRLAALILSQPDFLILDEPTNHLDIQSCEVLENALQDFSGTVLTVSHDRYFLDRIVNRLLILRRDQYQLHTGNYSEYEQLAQREATAKLAATKKRKKNKKNKTVNKVEHKNAPSPYDHLSADELELIVIGKESELAVLQERFGDPAILKDPDAMAELQEELEYAETALAEVDTAWQQRAADQ